MEIFNRGPGYFTGTNFSVGKHEAAVRSGALSGTSMSGSPMNSDRRRVGFCSTKKPKSVQKVVLPTKVINIQGL